MTTKGGDADSGRHLDASPTPSRQTLKRADRIRKRREFLRVQEGGARASTRHFLVLLSPHVGGAAATTRLGVVASRKVGNAVLRNRAKRLVREAFRLNRGVFPEACDCVIIVRTGAPALSLREVETELGSISRLMKRRVDEIRRASRDAGLA